MKSLTVLVLCCLCRVNTYRIFPLPRQNVASTSKLGSFDQSTLRSTDQTTKAPEVNSRLTTFMRSSLFSVKSGSQPQTYTTVRTTFGNFAKPSSTAQSVSSTFKSTVAISATNQKSILGSNQKPVVTTIPAVKNTFGNVARPLSIARTAVPPTSQTLTAAKILNRPNSNDQASTFIQKPEQFAVEPPAKDLLPPKEDSNLGLLTKVNTVPSRPTVEVPFNDLLPPKTS